MTPAKRPGHYTKGVELGVVPAKDRILMVSPFHRQQRGNSLTTARIKQGLESRGYTIDLLSLEESEVISSLEAKVKPDKYILVHGFHALHFARFWQRQRWLQEIPLVLTTTGTDLHYDLYSHEKSLIEGIFQAAQKIVVFHQNFVTLISQLYPALQPKLISIPQGIFLPPGPPESNQRHFQENDFIFLLPSGLRPVKNLELAIDALEKLQPDYPQLRLLIMGAKLHPQYSQTIMERINLLPWIKYLGEIPHEQVHSVMMHSDVVINCSHAEGQPQGALEAMSLGKPCILTAVPGNLKIIEHGKEGFYVHDEKELLQAARSYLNQPELTLKMGQAASNLVARNFSMEKELTAYLSLYQQILQ